MRISDIMTRNPMSVATDAKVSEVKQIMAQNDFKHLPVVGPDGKISGLITDRDIKLHQAVSNEEKFHESATIEAFYLRYPYRVGPDESARDVVQHMYEQNIGSTIVTENGELTGIFTSMDACRVLRDLLPAFSDDN